MAAASSTLPGTAFWLKFPSVIDAVECAIEIQTVMATRNEGVPEQHRMLFRIGINLDDVIHDGTRIYGDGINVPQFIAFSWAICCSVIRR